MSRHGTTLSSDDQTAPRPPYLAACLALALLAASGCSMARLHRELSEARGLGLLSGPVTTPAGGTDNVVVALYRHGDEGLVLEDADRLSSVVGSYAFILEAGERYLVAAFHDLDGDLVPDAGEPAAVYGRNQPIVVAPEENLEDRRLLLHAAGARSAGSDLGGIDFSGLQQASFDSIPIAAGEVVSLEDPRFSAEQAKAGMWSPLTSVREVGGGIFFLEPYDPERTPVLFVHGIGGSPRDFGHLIEGLDRRRFQPWVYHYPSGARLERAGRLLAQLTESLRRDLGFERLLLTAHSMGGLVARSALAQLDDRRPIELFVTFSTPWNGHRGAQQGVKYAPAVVPSWIDMQPASDFLAGLRAELPDDPPHHLFFGFNTKRNLLMPYSHDTVIAVSSQLDPWFQERAERLYGYDLDHVGILGDQHSAAAYHRILQRSRP